MAIVDERSCRRRFESRAQQMRLAAESARFLVTWYDRRESPLAGDGNYNYRGRHSTTSPPSTGSSMLFYGVVTAATIRTRYCAAWSSSEASVLNAPRRA